MRFHIKNGEIIVMATNSVGMAKAAALAYKARIWDTKYNIFLT